jgi:hypothetical protein
MLKKTHGEIEVVAEAAVKMICQSSKIISAFFIVFVFAFCRFRAENETAGDYRNGKNNRRRIKIACQTQK